jgi:hypothetical protein
MRIISFFLLSIFIINNAYAYTPKAAQMSIEDRGNKYTSETLEGALQEIASKPSFSIINADIINWSYAYTHSGYVGTKQVDETDIGNNKILKYDSTSGKVIYTSSASVEEADPVFSAWATTNDYHANWNTAYGWGNHASAGYVSTSSTPVKNYAFLWNGTSAVWAAQGTSFTFSIASFSSAQSSPQLIGTGVWKAAGGITFTASYNNGPATSGYVSKSGWSNLNLTNTYQGPTVSAEAVNYPAVGSSVTFTLHATDGTDTDTETSSIAFYNYIYYGTSTVLSGYTEANVEGLANSTISNTKGRTITLTVADNYYIVYALPVRLGTVTFTVGGFEGGFQSPETVSVTNSAGYTENYYVYRSTNEGLGSTTVVVQ